MSRNGIISGVNSEGMRAAIMSVAAHELEEINDIAAALRGY
jgi:hypothetical protein